MPGTLFVVATPIGTLEDITLRALRVLREVTLIAAEDTRRTARLLAHHGITTRTTSLHAHNERRKASRLIEVLDSGGDVALLTDAGTPGISDPGAALVRAVAAAGIRVEPLPGASALTTALSGAGLEANEVLFVGFLPSRAGERLRRLRALAACPAVLAFFEAPHRLGQMLEAVEQVFGADAATVIAHELTKMHESWHRGPIGALRVTGLPGKGEFTILIDNQTPSRRGDAEVAQVQLAPPLMFAEFCYLTKTAGLSRRDAIARLATTHGVSKKLVYGAIESGKGSGE